MGVDGSVGSLLDGCWAYCRVELRISTLDYVIATLGSGFWSDACCKCILIPAILFLSEMALIAPGSLMFVGGLSVNTSVAETY